MDVRWSLEQEIDQGWNMGGTCIGGRDFQIISSFKLHSLTPIIFSSIVMGLFFYTKEIFHIKDILT
jgi:hypothetical protein